MNTSATVLTRGKPDCRIAEYVGQVHLDPRRVLIIDDTRSIHNDFRKILASPRKSNLEEEDAEMFGGTADSFRGNAFEMDSAYQGEEGLELVQRALATGTGYSVAFVDVRMPPGWDGIETAAQLRAADPDIQIVICTAYSDYSWITIVKRLGNSDSLVILKKPFDTVEVLQLAHALSKKWLLTKQSKSRFAELEARVDERTEELRVLNQKLHKDIAKREQAEARLNHLLRESPAIIFSLKSNGGTSAPAWVSENVINLLGYSAAECSLPQWWPTHVHPADWDRVSTERAQQSRDRVATLEYRIRQKNGDYCWVRDQRRRVCDSAADSTEIVGTWVDITPQKELENQLRQAQKMEAVGQLAGGVAHDFNNLLAVILGNTELALMGSESNLSKQKVECLKQVVAATQRASNLTRQLLAFSRKQILHSRPVNLNNIIGNLSNMLNRIIGENVELQCHYDPSLPLVQADIGMIEQVLVNLVVNARDAMPEGGELRIITEKRSFTGCSQVHPEARAGEFVGLSVTDTGSGIAAENLPHLFEPFFTTKEIGKGTGLGLATVHGIVKQHQGWIEVASEIQAGSNFRIFLPVFAGPSLPEDSIASEETFRGGAENILLVEDDKAVRTFTCQMLESFGYDVQVAASGPEAMELWRNRSNDFKLLLTDIIMPRGITGIELAEKLGGQRADLKIIFMSGYAGDALGKRGAMHGELKHRLLQKPFHSQELLRTVRQCLDEK